MASLRKDARPTACCALMMMYAMAIMETRMNLVFVATTSARLLRAGRNDSRQPTVSEDGARRRRSDFLDRLEGALAGHPASADGTSSDKFAVVIAKGGEVYCRESQMESLSRGRYFVQMLREGLNRGRRRDLGRSPPGMSPSDAADFAAGIPVLIKHDDSNGCYPATRSDRYGFPRLTWSIPAVALSYHGQEPPHKERSWCSAIGMPSFKAWKDLGHRGNRGRSDRTIDNHESYPWSEKLPKAVWRGSTTCNKGMYGSLPLQSIPRSKLVESSLRRPDVIDAGFHKMVGRYKDGETLDADCMLKEAIPLEDMMKYKAIIDIDGNNWSARFAGLLCSNSVVIKIAPDFVEEYYRELTPDVHYIPASLENITEVVEHVLDEGNDVRMRGIVRRANEWCRASSRKESLAIKAMEAVKAYRGELDDRYGTEWMSEWEARLASKKIDDLVECYM